MIQVTLPYPVSANVYWRTFRGITVVSKRALEYRDSVKAICYAHGIQAMEGNLAVFYELCAKKPKKDTGKEPRVMDLSNAIKVAEDALQGAAYANDKQVKAFSIRYGDPVPGGALRVKIVQA